MTYQDALEKYIQGTNSHNFNNIEEIIHNEAVYWFTGRSYSGRLEIKKYFESTWDSIKDEKYIVTDIKWIAVDGSVATCLYTYQWSGYYQDKFVEGSGRATNVFIFENGRWFIIHEHLTPNINNK